MHSKRDCHLNLGLMDIIIPLHLIILICSHVAHADATGSTPNATNVIAKNKRLIVGIIEAEPYARMIQGSNGREYQGYLPDLVSALSHRLGFNYDYRQIKPATDGLIDNENHAWTGIVQELLKREKSLKENKTEAGEGIDLAAAAISITAERQRVASFVKPFLRLGITVLIKRPTMKEIDREDEMYFTVIQAFDPAVWIGAVVSALAVGILLWLMNKYNPYEYGIRYELGLAEKAQAELFNLRGSLWFVFTTMQWQGFERAPRSIASKFLAGIWFTFVTIFLATFAASVMNKLFFASLDPRSRAVPERFLPHDLSHLITSLVNPYKCGAVIDSQALDYINNVAKGPEFDMLRSHWSTEEGKALLIGNVSAGIERVRSDGEKYALIVDRMVANYYINRRPCDLMSVGRDFGLRAYGLAMPKNSPYIEDFHRIILQLEEEGELEQLQRRWFIDRGECWNDTSRTSKSRAGSWLEAQQPSSVDTSTFSAPLGLVILGLTLSAVIALAEMIYYTYRGRYSGRARHHDGHGHIVRLENEEPPQIS